MTKKDKMEALIAAVKNYDGIVHGNWRDGGGGEWLDAEFPDTISAVLCLSNYGDLTAGARPRDEIRSFTASVVVEIPLEPGEDT